MRIDTSPAKPPENERRERVLRVRCTCLVNNFNYQDYVVEAVESALAQTRPFDEIIVVDDGSTDRSREILQRRFRDEPRVRIVAKDNAGQLSCFNVGFVESTGDLLFFLDADDRYRPNYVAEAVRFFDDNPDCELSFCDYRVFGGEEKEVQWGDRSKLLGYSLIHTLYRRAWIGAPTSCLAARRSFAEKLLPLPLEEDWRIRADDCLIFGAGLLNARKGYLHDMLVEYRSHGNNHHRNVKPDPFAEYLHGVGVQRLFGWIMMNRRLEGDTLINLAHREFRTHADPTYRMFRQYMKLVWRSNLPWSKRGKSMLSMCGYFLSSRWRQRTAADSLRTPGPKMHQRHQQPSSDAAKREAA